MPGSPFHHLFLVGPASVGKSTVGRALATRLCVGFIDVDLEFNSRIENITAHIASKGYESYARKNSELVERLIKEASEPIVFSLPAGFLVHESVPELVAKHIELLHRHGITILLLPSKDPEDTVDIVVARQLARWGVVPGESERDRFIRRFNLYIQHGDIQIFSTEAPEAIAKKIETELKLRHPYWFKV